MRVTQNSSFEAVNNSISRTKERMEKLQIESGSMRKVNRPSDDPIGTAKILDIRTDKVNTEQYQTNAKLAETQLQLTDHALSEMGDILARAKEIGLQQASGASSTGETRIAVAEEVKQLYEQAVAVGNRRVGDRYLFAGFKTKNPPIATDGKYKGDLGQIMVEIGRGVFLTTNIHGAEAFNTDYKSSQEGRDLKDSPSRSPAVLEDEDIYENFGKSENINAFSELQNMRIALMTGDIDGIRSNLERLDDIHTHVLAIRAKLSSRVQGLGNMMNSLDRASLTNAKLTSDLEDADMAQVMSDLAKEEIVFRSALGTSHKLIQPTLLDFLK